MTNKPNDVRVSRELLPCPFCGGSVKEPINKMCGFDPCWTIKCNCGLTFGAEYTEDGLVRKWNRRALLAQPADPLIVKLTGPREWLDELAKAALADQQPTAFQSRVQPWMTACFGAEISADRQERNHRFLEEALELVQACGATPNEAHQLVDYVYGRPVGEPAQEVGGVMVTLAALCLANGLDMHASAETELSRIWTKVDQIRAKQAAKPAMSPLPGVYPDRIAQPADQQGEPIWLYTDCDGYTGWTDRWDTAKHLPYLLQKVYRHAQPATAKVDERAEFEKSGL
uniref:Restriction alleviation protein n=1 Tax=Pseudomonas phage Orisa03 TaxID=3138542 RepID=A0AAU6W255_9VIRU